jgi:GT2 family glycosyltransferase
MKLSVIVVNYKTKKLTGECLKSVIKNTKKIDYELIVVDNASNDGSVEYLSECFTNKIKIIRSKKNLGFGYANNLALKKAKGEYTLLLNSDTILRDDVLKDIVSWMDNNTEVGVFSCKLYGKDGKVQENGGYFPTLPRVFSWMTIQDLPLVDRLIKPFHPLKEKSLTKEYNFYSKYRELDWVTGAFFLLRIK